MLGYDEWKRKNEEKWHCIRNHHCNRITVQTSNPKLKFKAQNSEIPTSNSTKYYNNRTSTIAQQNFFCLFNKGHYINKLFYFD